MEYCKHDKGTYHDKEDMNFSDLRRCFICDEVTNYSLDEFYDEFSEIEYGFDDDF